MAYEPKFGNRSAKLRVGRANATGSSGTDGSGITLIKQYLVSVDPASMLTTASQALAVTVTGVSTDDVVICAEPQAALEAGISIDYTRVSAANTIVIGFTNNTGGTVNPAAVNFKFVCMRIASTDL
jgi:hypothetical protein